MAEEEEYEDLHMDTQSDVSDFDPEALVLQPVQKRIEAQLRKHLQELQEKVRETNGELKIIRQQREDCGVELYNFQQQLAKLQENLERDHEKYHAAQVKNEEMLREKAQLASQSESLRRLLEEMRKRYESQQKDVGRVSDTLTKVEEYNTQLKSEILVERRAAYKAEVDIANLEKVKLRQDKLVDALQERIRMLSEQKDLMLNQIEAQRKESAMARETLAEALAEMESVNFEKKQLVQQWRSSVIGLQRRDEAMKKTEEAVQQQRDAIHILDTEIAGNRKELKQVQTENGKLTEFLSRIQNEVLVLEKQLEHLAERKQQDAQKYITMKHSMEAADAESKALDKEIKVYDAEIQRIDNIVRKEAKEVLDMETKLLEVLGKQTTLKQESKGALMEIEKTKKIIQMKELNLTQMENELARIRVDTVQTESHNEVIKGILEELETELQSRGSMIERMQTDIRRRHDEIERKQKQLDQLNHQYESIMAAHGALKGEHVGPLEATIKSLTKAIAEKTRENEQLQHQWIKLQTELVTNKNVSNDLSEAIQDLQAQCTILSQKRDRLLSFVADEKQQIASLEKKTNAMHLEMKRVNVLLSKTAQDQEVIANETALLENDLTKRMKERKREALALQQKIEENKLLKNEVMADILNCERDIMVWEKKIQLIRETEAALDPNIGKEEVLQMKREISIMEQRLAYLQREQRQRVEEMEKLVDQREILRAKGQAVQQATVANKRGVTRLTVNKENANLARELSEKKKEAKLKEAIIKDSLAHTERAAEEVERTQQEVEQLEEQIEELKGRWMVAAQERQRAEDERQLKQRSLERLQDSERGVYRLSVDPERVMEERRNLIEQRKAVVAAMEQVAEQYPTVSPSIDGLLHGLADPE